MKSRKKRDKICIYFTNFDFSSVKFLYMYMGEYLNTAIKT